jgi:zinc transport system substrate-binding protein
MKKTFFLLAIAAMFFICGCAGEMGQTAPGKLTVTASFYPLAEFAHQVAGNNATVVDILPPGAEDHGFEPTSQDLTKIHTSRLFISNGAGIDPWAGKITPDLEKEGVKTSQMSDDVELLNGDPNGEDYGASEPHFWLDPENAIIQVNAIKDSLAAIDPANASQYTANAAAYISKLRQLNQDYKQGLSNCSQKEFVTSHAAFAYLAKRYNLTQIPIAGISPEEEPSPKRLAELSGLLKEKNIKYVFTETLVSPRLAETLANEVGAQTLVLHHIGSLTPEELQAGKNYINLMESNLVNLKTALACK